MCSEDTADRQYAVVAVLAQSVEVQSFRRAI